MKRTGRWFVAAAAVWLALLVAVGGVHAQAPDAEEAPAEAVASPLREQTIYVPYDNLRKTFEKEGRGVFLPYEKFRELWDAARAARTPEGEGKPPREALVTEIESEASVRGEVIEVRAVLKIEILGKGWHEIPLRLADTAITEARIAGKPARLLADPGKGYRLVIENPGDTSHQVELNLTYAKGINRAPGQNSVAFQAPRAPVNRWKVRIPEAGVKVDIHPMIAATEVTEEAADDAEAKPEEGSEEEGSEAAESAEPEKPVKPEETVILAFVGAAPEVRIAWTPKAEGATGLAALASVQTEQRMVIGEGVTRTAVQLAYAISRAELAQLQITVPGDQKVVNVFDANVRQWSVEADGDRQKVTIQLFEPAKGSQNVTVELEKFWETSATTAPEESDEESGEETEPPTSEPVEITTPVVEAVGVGRQQGVVVVQVDEGLRGEVLRKTGLVQLDAGDLPASLAKVPHGFSYRYVSVPYELTFGVEKIEPRITADMLVEARISPERLNLTATVIYNVQRAGVFRLEMEVPSGYEVQNVVGRAVGGAQAVEVDGRHIEGEDKTRLVVSLRRKAIGRVGMTVYLDRRLEHPELRAPTGETVEIAMPVPRIPADTVERATGRLVVYAPESLRVNPIDPIGLRSISPAEALAGMNVTQGGSARAVLAYAFGEEEPSLKVAAERRKPQVTVRQLLVARVEDGVTKYELSLFYDVLYSGIKSLRIDIPESVAELLRNKTKTIREQVIEEPEDLTEGCVAWSLTGTTELLGSGRIDLTWDAKVDNLEAGSSVLIDIPWVRAVGADRQSGQIVLTKAETIDLGQTDVMSGLRPIDPQHDLINGVKVEDAVQAFEFHDEWEFQVSATRYDLEDIKQTSIDKAVLRMVLTRSGNTAVQALYRIRSSDQRLELRMPEGAEFDADPRIDGRSVTMEMGQKRSYFIPLLGTQEDRSFLLELRYTLAEPRLPIAWPEFPTHPAVQKVYLCVYVPEEIDLLDTTGPWTREFLWGLDAEGRFDPRNSLVVGSDTTGTEHLAIAQAEELADEYQDDAVVERLLTWVCEPQSLPDDYMTDGRLFVFSSVRPGSPVDDGLHLLRLRGGYVNTAVLLVVLLTGLLLLPMGFARRVFVVGILAIAMVFCAIFWPMAVWNLCDVTLVYPALIVAAVWAIQFLAFTLPRAVRECRPGRPPTDPPGPIAAEPVPDTPRADAKSSNEGGPSNA